VKSIALLCEGCWSRNTGGRKKKKGEGRGGWDQGVLCQLVVGTTNRGLLPALAEGGTIWVSAEARLCWKNASGC